MSPRLSGRLVAACLGLVALVACSPGESLARQPAAPSSYDGVEAMAVKLKGTDVACVSALEQEPIGEVSLADERYSCSTASGARLTLVKFQLPEILVQELPKVSKTVVSGANWIVEVDGDPAVLTAVADVLGGSVTG